MMWKFLRGGATVIPGATFIPESRVACILLNFCIQKSFVFSGDDGAISNKKTPIGPNRKIKWMEKKEAKKKETSIDFSFF